MKKFTILFLVFPLITLATINAFDKDKFADHLRKALNEPATTKFTVGDLRKSEFKGFKAFIVTMHSSKGAADQEVYITNDEKKYILGTVFDLTVDPDMERFKQIDLKNVHAKGSKKAPVVIVEYSDLQCGYCKKAHNAFEEELYKNYKKDEVRIIFKHFPLRFHKWAEAGAIATVCAAEQRPEAFWEMTNKMFENTQNHTPENIRDKAVKYAGELKLDKKKFSACMESSEAKEKVAKEKREGIQLGVRSTPTFYINGRQQRGFRDFATFKPFIDEKLKEVK